MDRTWTTYLGMQLHFPKWIKGIIACGARLYVPLDYQELLIGSYECQAGH